MLKQKKIVVVLPAYNAQKTLSQTVNDIDRSIVDTIILVDDNSKDFTVEVAKSLNLIVYKHDKNLGYGANQKSCYKLALDQGADIVIMVHPDYQYTPKLIPAMCYMLVNDVYDVVLGSRILGSRIVSKNMPGWRWAANRFLTMFQNILLGEKLSEYHTGYRAFTKEVLMKLPYQKNSNDFIFDNEMLCQAIYFSYKIGEISCPVKYDVTSSSISFTRSVIYGFGVLRVTIEVVLHKLNIRRTKMLIKHDK